MATLMHRTAHVFGLAIFLAGALASAATDDTAQNAYMTEAERAVVAELNLARTQPKKYAEFIEQWTDYYDGKLRKLPDRVPVRTKEGVKALREAVSFLNRQTPVHALEPRRGLAHGARDHVADMGPSGATGHKGYDESDVGERVNRYGRWQRKVAENIAYGSESPREVVMDLIIDDGVKSRGHRKNIFDPDFRVVGVAMGHHAIFGTMCVITLAADYLE